MCSTNQGKIAALVEIYQPLDRFYLAKSDYYYTLLSPWPYSRELQVVNTGKSGVQCVLQKLVHCHPQAPSHPSSLPLTPPPSLRSTLLLYLHSLPPCLSSSSTLTSPLQDWARYVSPSFLWLYLLSPDLLELILWTFFSFYSMSNTLPVLLSVSLYFLFLCFLPPCLSLSCELSTLFTSLLSSFSPPFPNLSDIEFTPVWCWTYQIPNLFDTELIRYRTSYNFRMWYTDLPQAESS